MNLSKVNEKQLTSSPSSFDLFKQSYVYFNEYYLTNAVVDNGRIEPNYENLISKKEVYFRTKSEVIKDINDEDIVAFPDLTEEYLRDKN